jgi:hypothetical protein
VPRVPSSVSRDRYEPLPGLTEFPGYLVRKLPPSSRRPLAVVAGLLLVALIAGLAVAIPAITESKEERSAAQQRAERERQAERTAALEAQLRLERGRGTAARGLSGGAALEARRALVGDLEAAVLADATARVRSGELTQSVLRIECERFPRGVGVPDPAADLSSRSGRYSCLAITADAPRSESQNPSSIGYPYRALVDFPSGRFAFCKITGRPGEGGLVREGTLRVPAACGGGA